MYIDVMADGVSKKMCRGVCEADLGILDGKGACFV